MSRRYDQPLRCTNDHEGIPTVFWWRGQRYRVQKVLDTWRETGEWWNGEHESVWFRVQTLERGLFELYQNVTNKEWRLWKVID